MQMWYRRSALMPQLLSRRLVVGLGIAPPHSSRVTRGAQVFCVVWRGKGPAPRSRGSRPKIWSVVAHRYRSACSFRGSGEGKKELAHDNSTAWSTGWGDAITYTRQGIASLRETRPRFQYSARADVNRSMTRSLHARTSSCYRCVTRGYARCSAST